MGFFSLKTECSICGKEIGMNRFRISKSNGWICPQCLKLAGGPKCVNLYEMTAEDIKKQIENPALRIDLSKGAFQLPLSEKKKRIAENKANGIACCPKCGSASLSANKKGFGVGKAVVGAYVAGPVGLVAGNIGAKKVWVTCLNCGHRWKI